MRETSTNQYFPSMKRVEQITDAHCGPAVIEMLASHYVVDIDQQQVVEAGGVGDKLQIDGMNLDDLALACSRLLPPTLQFWYKTNSTISELYQITSAFGLPVGVEWQGVFDDSDGEDGHYSVVTHVDTVHNFVAMADPYGEFAQKDRIFRVTFFERRWWDTNEIYNPVTKKSKLVEDYHTLFIIASKDVTFPQRLSMTRGMLENTA